MRVGLQVPYFTWAGGQAELGKTFASLAERAEQAGFYSFWLMDHFFQISIFGPPELEMLESWSALAFAAAKTSTIKLGTLVTGITYRHPGILIKTATTLDVLSGGRAYLGVGAAWNEEEHRGLGVPYPPLKERFERLEETLQIAHHMWNGDERPFKGKHYQLDRPLNSPQSIQRPHPPILIGGTGEKKTLRMIAQYGDACNIFSFIGEDALKQKLAVLRAHCEDLGRTYSDIEKTIYDAFAVTEDGRDGSLTPTQVIARLRTYADVGFDHIILSVKNDVDAGVLELFGREIIPEVGTFVNGNP